VAIGIINYSAVVTNMWSRAGQWVWQGHRERWGTVGKAIDVLKNDLAGGTMPGKRLFATAAGFRLNVMAYNVLAVMKRQSLPLAW